MFIHLHNYSDYSLLQSTIKVKELVDLAASHSMPAIALTDNNNLSGSLEFSEYAIQKGVQPIIGCDIDIKHKQNKKKVLLLVKNQTGYKNLLHIVYQSSKEELSLSGLNRQLTEGLILLTGDLLCSHLLKSEQIIEQLQLLFQDNLYIQLPRLDNTTNELEPTLINVAYKHNIPIVGTNKVLFAKQADYQSYDALTCIKQSKFINDTTRVKCSDQHYFKSIEESKRLFSDIPEAINNSITIAKRCSFLLQGSKPTLPQFPCKTNENDEIRNQAYQGLETRLNNNITDQYKQRMEYELQTITKMGYAGYFLIVSDFIKWSKNNDVPVGPGRGSGVGSIVAWALQITDLDPIKFSLIFERFLNPERISMPDFDIDFCQQKRDLVIRYIQKKYGHVAQITTFGNLQPRAVLRDVGRVLQIPYFQVDQICKMIPQNPVRPVTLSEAIELDPELQKAQKQDETIHQLLKISLKLEGLHRHASTHAAGIVISSRPLVESIAISHDQESNIPITQYSMKYVEKAGLVKFDLLGLKTLTIINATCKLTANKVNINAIPITCQKTFSLLSKGGSVGVFQLENTFMRQTLKKLQADCLEDIIALISLNRPGPMDNIPTYIARKHRKESIDYIHPTLETVLKETVGVIIYQEQVMQIAQIIAGYTMAAADLLRRAMGKKIKSEMDMQQSIFVKGAVKNGIPLEKATYIFNLVAKFAGYGFNKSHAAAYALISYQTAYLKANYPVEFLTASMNLDIQDSDKLQLFCNEAKQNGIEILPPDINHSQPLFTVENGSIRYGLAALKSVGLGAITEACTRKYSSIHDFANNCNLGKRAIESLAKCGAFSSIHQNRKQIYDSATIISHTNNNDAQTSLFDNNDIHLITTEDWSKDKIIYHEQESIGFFLNKHPISKYAKLLNKINLNNIIIGIVTNVRMRSSPRGKFCIMVLSDPNQIYDVAFYSNDVIEEKKELFAVGKEVAITSQKRENGIVGNQIQALDTLITSSLPELTLYIHNHDIISTLPQFFSERGNTKVILRIRSKEQEFDVALPYAYKVCSNQIATLEGVEII